MDCGRCSAGHAIVGGCDHLGGRIALELAERGCSVVIVDRNPEAVPARVREVGCAVIQGDIGDEDALRQAGATDAACFIAATGDDRANLEAAIAVRQMNSTCAVVARLYDQALGERVEKVFGIRALSASSLASPAFVSAATDDSIISALTVEGCCVSFHPASAKPSGASGQYVTRTGPDLGLTSDPNAGGDTFFAAVHGGKHHAYLGRSRKRASKRGSAFPVAKLSPALLVREVVGTWRHAATITRRLTVALLAVMALSVAVFSGAGQMSPLDAIYFVVTTMTTVGYGDFNLQHSPPGLKAYGIVMMLCGAALLATVYAIIADRVLAARVEYLLGRRRVSLHGHTIVVGLGKVGYRVAAELASLGERIVAVEAVEDSDNVSSARGMFPVVIGDASRTSVLTKAAVDSADALLALTDDPLLNLSVALSATEHNPGIRTVVRTYDVGLAEKFRSSGLDLAMSTSAIAAPVFADVALYPHVRGSFHLGGDDVLIARYVVGGESPLLGRTPAQIVDDLGAAVIATADARQSPYVAADTDRPLQDGQKVLVLLTRTTLDRLPTPLGT